VAKAVGDGADVMVEAVAVTGGMGAEMAVVGDSCALMT
jgi:hypothetical protein